MAKSLDAAKKEQQQQKSAILNDPRAWSASITACVGRQEWDGEYLRYYTDSEADAQRQLRDWAEHNIIGVYRVIQTPHAARQIVVLNEVK